MNEPTQKYISNLRSKILNDPSGALECDVELIARCYFQDDSITDEQYFSVLNLAEMFNPKLALDYLDINILKTRTHESLSK